LASALLLCDRKTVFQLRIQLLDLLVDGVQFGLERTKGSFLTSTRTFNRRLDDIGMATEFADAFGDKIIKCFSWEISDLTIAGSAVANNVLACIIRPLLTVCVLLSPWFRRHGTATMSAFENPLERQLVLVTGHNGFLRKISLSHGIICLLPEFFSHQRFPHSLVFLFMVSAHSFVVGSFDESFDLFANPFLASNRVFFGCALLVNAHLRPSPLGVDRSGNLSRTLKFNHQLEHDLNKFRLFRERDH